MQPVGEPRGGGPVLCLEHYQALFAMLGKSGHPWQHHSWYLNFQNNMHFVSLCCSYGLRGDFTPLHKHLTVFLCSLGKLSCQKSCDQLLHFSLCIVVKELCWLKLLMWRQVLSSLNFISGIITNYCLLGTPELGSQSSGGSWWRIWISF